MSLSSTQPLRVCFFGTYRATYVRNEVIIEGLRANGVTVIECHSTLWHSVADRVEQAGGGWKQPAFWGRVFKAYWHLWQAYRQVGDYDVLLVGYPGQFDVYLARWFTWLRGKPLALDILMSLHLIAEERGLTKKSPLTGRLIFLLEKYGLHRPDMLIADTPEYQRYYSDKYKLPPERFQFVPLGVDDRLYQPRPRLQPPTDVIRVIYYGTFIPLHGVPTMLRAAALLQDRVDIRFDFYGEGQELPSAQQLAGELGLMNLHFHGWLDKEKLPDEIAQSHIVLGVFGTTKQALCTIQNKIWEGMMMQRAVITGEAETLQEELTHERHVYMVERANPQALANGITRLADNAGLREYLGQQGHERAQDNTIQATGRAVYRALQTIIRG